MVRPVVLATFANDRYGPTTGYLRDLVGERRAVEAALEHSPVEVVVRGNVTLDELFDLFSRYGDRLVAWHHGGHAEADALFVETEAGAPTPARMDGLAARIGQLARLRLLVLNGCSTAPQVETLRAHTTAAIVATDRAIVDAAARDFAGRLYRDLAAGRTLGESFASAASRVESEVDGPSRLLRPGMAAEPGRPWRLHTHPDHPEAAEWRLSDATPRRRLWVAAPLLGGLSLAALVFALWPGEPTDADGRCTAGVEVCNGADDDCDQSVDETASCTAFGMGPVWGEGRCVEGICQMTACPAGWHDIDGVHDTGCEYACVPTGEESCNGIDDDCDGIVDDGFEGCDLRCDGVDDDGDGRSDEGCPLTRCGPERAGHAPVPPCNGCPDGIEVPAGWVCIPPGEAELGSAPGAARERGVLPRRRVRFARPFLMMATEVTRAQWAAVAAKADAGRRPSHDHCRTRPDDACPVDRVNWSEAVWFAHALSLAEGRTPCYAGDALSQCYGWPGGGCDAGQVACAFRYGQPPRATVFHCPSSVVDLLTPPADGCSGHRLPTADEWEYAARAGETAEVPADLDAVAWSVANSGRQTHPVATRAANRWGLYDMLGNVGEPVHDDWQARRGGDARGDLEDTDFVTPKIEDPNYRLHRWGIRLVRDLPDGD